MPTPRTAGRKIGAGTLDKTGIDALALISAFPVQSDQHPIRWQDPPTTPASFPRRAEAIEMNDGSVMRDGFYQFDWEFIFTNDMLTYWLATLFSSGAADSADVSILTYDREDVAMYLNAHAIQPTPERGTLTPLIENGQPAPGMWRVIQQIRGGVDIT